MNKQHSIIALTILIIGILGYFIFSDNSKTPDSKAPQGHAVPVSVLKMEPEKIHVIQELPGRISPFRQSQVRPQVAGIVTKRFFEEGSDVQKGQQLYQIDDKRYKAALNSALADLKSATANVKAVEARATRYEELVKINAVSKQEYDDAIAKLDQANAAIAVAQAAVDTARVSHDYTKVYAPISGRIGRSFVTEGALVTANQQQHLTTITQLDPVYVDMQLSGSEALSLRAKMTQNITSTVTLSINSGAVYPEVGTLKFSEVTVDETASSVNVRALMPNNDGILLPGLFVRATIDLGKHDALLVPQRASIRTPQGGLIVWVVDSENKAQMRPITTEGTYEDNWIITDGLNKGDQVIIEGYIKVGAGTPVTTTPWNPHNATSEQKQTQQQPEEQE